MPFLKNDERGLHEKHCVNCNNELQEVNDEKEIRFYYYIDFSFILFYFC